LGLGLGYFYDFGLRIGFSILGLVEGLALALALALDLGLGLGNWDCFFSLGFAAGFYSWLGQGLRMWFNYPNRNKVKKDFTYSSPSPSP
jgi:hypothetical protein